MSASLTDDVRRALRKTGERLHALIAIGNPLRGDDGVGPALAARLAGLPGLFVLDAGDRPEDAVGALPEGPFGWIVLADAADFGGTPGEVRLIERSRIPETAISTHRVSPAVVCALLAADTGCPVSVVGIQPAFVGFGEGLSPAVAASVDALAAFIREEFSHA